MTSIKKRRIALSSASLLAAATAFVAFHPGVAAAEPRFAHLDPVEFDKKATYALDPNHSGIYFEINHLGLSTVTGRFNKLSGTFVVDPNNLTESTVDFSAEIGSIDTAIPARDTHLRSADFFDATKFPKLTFKGTKIEKRGTGYVITGDLTIKDKTKFIQIPFKFFGPYAIPGMDFPPSIGVVAEPITLKRSDFGVGGFDKFSDGVQGASDEVLVRISFEASEQK